jgi:HD-like signal output (HDOD) protein
VAGRRLLGKAFSSGGGDISVIKRGRQFFSGLFARLSEKDYTFAIDRLTEPELKLFMTMSAYDQKHACSVAMALEDESASLDLVRAGLLHDIGKAMCPELTLLRRSAAVFLEWAAPEDAAFLADRGRGKMAKALKAHRMHPSIGAVLLREIGTDDYIVALVEGHQSPNEADCGEDALRLKRTDDRF